MTYTKIIKKFTNQKKRKKKTIFQTIKLILFKLNFITKITSNICIFFLLIKIFLHKSIEKSIESIFIKFQRTDLEPSLSAAKIKKSG